MDDTELAALARRGDPTAYEMLVQQHEALAFRTAYLIVGSAEEAEDAAQEGFVKAYYNLARFRPDAPFRPWLLRIVANEARNRRKAAQRREHLALRLTIAQSLESHHASPEVEVLRKEQRQALVEAIRRLREEDRLVIACRYFLELSEAETATTLDCPQGTVKSRLSRALTRLRGMLSTPEKGSASGIEPSGPFEKEETSVVVD